MRIRRAETHDIGRIHELLHQVNMIHHNGRPDIFRRGARKYTDEELVGILGNEKTPVFVAVDGDDRVLGYAFCIMEDHRRDNNMTDIVTLYIDDLCVDEKERGRHVGTALFEYVTSFAKERGCYNVTLNVWCVNPGAMAFYDRMGMKPMKIYMEKLVSDQKS